MKKKRARIFGAVAHDLKTIAAFGDGKMRGICQAEGTKLTAGPAGGEQGTGHSRCRQGGDECRVVGRDTTAAQQERGRAGLECGHLSPSKSEGFGVSFDSFPAQPTHVAVPHHKPRACSAALVGKGEGQLRNGRGGGSRTARAPRVSGEGCSEPVPPPWCEQHYL